MSRKPLKDRSKIITQTAIPHPKFIEKYFGKERIQELCIQKLFAQYELETGLKQF
jgi:hypothetical protein